MNTERIQVKQTEYCWVEFDLPLDILISDLQKCKEDGWEGITYEYGYDNEKEYYVYKTRLETEEEYNTRIKQEKCWKENRRRQYEQLKKEFG